MAYQFRNLANSTLSYPIGTSSTSIVVANPAKFPSNPEFVIRIDGELMLVTAVDGAQFTVTRAVEQANGGGPATNHASNSTVTHVLSVESYLQGLQQIQDDITEIQEELDGLQPTITGAASTIVTDDLTADRVVISNGSGKIAAASTTATELGYVSGVTSAIQTQLDAKQATITGGASSIASSNLTASRALVSDGSGKVAAASTTATELGYVSGVSSAIQTQLNNLTNQLATKQAIITGAASTATVSNFTAQRCVTTDSNGKLQVATNTTPIELERLSGVTSNVQSQINARNSVGGYGTVQLANGAGTFTSDSNLFHTIGGSLNMRNNGSSAGRAGYWMPNPSGYAAKMEGVSDGYNGIQLNFSVGAPGNSIQSAIGPYLAMVIDTGQGCDQGDAHLPLIRHLVATAYRGTVPSDTQIEAGEIAMYVDFETSPPELCFRAADDSGNLWEHRISIAQNIGGQPCGVGCQAFYR